MFREKIRLREKMSQDANVDELRPLRLVARRSTILDQVFGEATGGVCTDDVGIGMCEVRIEWLRGRQVIYT